jgi:glutathione S-transferase
MRLSKPILYSFRRCPYAMRARMALQACEIDLEHREILLRDKPAAMLEASPKGTVPVLVLPHGTVLEQSLDIMHWALEQNDPQGWLNPQTSRPDAMAGLIADNDGPFKTDLDRYKYADRHPEDAPDYHRDRGLGFLARLDTLLASNGQLFGSRISMADIAIFPFVRQFANTDRDWFDALPLPALQDWLAGHIGSELFETIMFRHATWQEKS